ASLVGDVFSWRTAFYVGGAMGLALLVLRIGVVESGMFHSVKQQDNVSRGDFLMLFLSAHRAIRYISVIVIAIPVWYVIGLLTTFAPELGRDMGMTVVPSASRSVMFCYIGLSIGGVASGVLSQILESRKRVLGLFLAIKAAVIVVYFLVGSRSLGLFYAT